MRDETSENTTHVFMGSICWHAACQQLTEKILWVQVDEIIAWISNPAEKQTWMQQVLNF
jgi:hypothetical protein